MKPTATIKGNKRDGYILEVSNKVDVIGVKRELINDK